MVDFFGPFNQLDAALQDLNMDGRICDFGVDPKAKSVDDVVIGKECLQFVIMQIIEENAQTV